MDLQELRLTDIVEQIGRPSPGIGGSTAAALSGLIGIALAKMAMLVTVTKGRARQHELIVAKLDSISMQLTQAAENDRVALQKYLEALQIDDAPTLEQARAAAATSPIPPAHLLIDALELLSHQSSHVAQNVLSDFYASYRILDAALAATLVVIDSNLKPDEMLSLRQRASPNCTRLRERQAEVQASIKKNAIQRGFVLD